MIHSETGKYWHKLLSGAFVGNSIFSLAVFLLLFFGTFVLQAEPVNVPQSFPDDPQRGSYSSILSRNRECEAPVFRSRLGQQLQLNARTPRSLSQYNIQRSDSGGSVVFEAVDLSIRTRDTHSKYNAGKASSYEFYSRYTLPVRAGPVFFND